MKEFVTTEAVAMADLKLGDTVFEADPWSGRVLVRHVLYEIVTSKWNEVFRKVADGYPKKRIMISGGTFGGGQEVVADDWGKKYFTSLTEAHRVCVERAVDLKAKRESQITNEIRELQKQLEKPVKGGDHDADH
jgi:hypothetical protein